MRKITKILLGILFLFAVKVIVIEAIYSTVSFNINLFAYVLISSLLAGTFLTHLIYKNHKIIKDILKERDESEIILSGGYSESILPELKMGLWKHFIGI